MVLSSPIRFNSDLLLLMEDIVLIAYLLFHVNFFILFLTSEDKSWS
jgi:hypothetical protein